MFFISDFVLKCIGEEAKFEGIRLLFDILQQPLLNKQVNKKTSNHKFMYTGIKCQKQQVIKTNLISLINTWWSLFLCRCRQNCWFKLIDCQSVPSRLPATGRPPSSWGLPRSHCKHAHSFNCRVSPWDDTSFTKHIQEYPLYYTYAFYKIIKGVSNVQNRFFEC